MCSVSPLWISPIISDRLCNTSWQEINQPHLSHHSVLLLLLCTVLSSYRKIPGNRCEGGMQPERKLIDLNKKCVSNLLSPELLVRDLYVWCQFGVYWYWSQMSGWAYLKHVYQSGSQTGRVAPVVSVVVLILLVCAVAGILLVKKYVCGGR